MSWSVAEQLLAGGLTKLGLTLTLAQGQQLLNFLNLLQKWSRVYNLTAVHEPEKMVTHHVLDSLAVAPYLKGPRIVDVGTGAGLPGIPLAMICPDFEFVLLDANAKKTRFVTQAITELGFANVTVERARAQSYQPTQPFDTIISRAFASLAEMLNMTQHLCAHEGRFLAMKGAYPADELAELPPRFALERIERVYVPGLDAERHAVLINISKVGP